MGEKKPKLMFFIGNMSSSGGTERVLSVIADGLLQRGYRVFIVSLQGRGKPFFSLRKEIKIYWVQKESKRRGIIGNLCYLTMVLERERPDYLVDVDTILGCYSLFLKHGRKKPRWISWDHFSFFHPFRKNRLLRKLVRRMAARYADGLVVLTDSDRKCYEEKLKPRCRVIRIYNPVPYRGVFLKDTEKPIVFTAGRLVEEKGFDLFVQSWKLLERRYPQWQAVVAGEGKEWQRLKRMAKTWELKRLHFTGKLNDIEMYYEKAAFAVLPSRYEGFGMVLVEAMYHSLPVVSYACQSGPEEIITDKVDGFLVPPGDVKAFARKMELLMKNEKLRKEMGKKASESVRRFDRERILNEWEKIFTAEDIGNHPRV